MRKVFVSCLVLILLVGCNAVDPFTNKPTPFYEIRKVEYENHTYILFSAGRNGGSGVVHDPNCPTCKTKGD